MIRKIAMTMGIACGYLCMVLMTAAQPDVSPKWRANWRKDAEGAWACVVEVWRTGRLEI